MEIDREVLDEAVARGEITPAQARSLFDAAARRRAAAAAGREPAWRTAAGTFALAGGSAAALLEVSGSLGAPGLAALAGALALALLAAGRQRLARSRGAQGQVLVTAAVLLVPLAVHGAARWLGPARPPGHVPGTLLEWVTGPWFAAQAATAVAALLAWRAFRIPFLALPVAAAAWAAAQGAAPLLFGADPGWAQRALLSSLCGVVTLAAGLAADRRARGEVATWLYLAGLLAFTGGTVTWTGASDLSLALVALLHAGLVAASLLLGRRAFAVAGALGLAAASGRLADDLLDAAALTFALATVALALVGLGLLYHLHEARLAAALQRRLPRRLRRLLPPAPGVGPR